MENVRETLLQLSSIEKRERKRALKDYIFYKGKCRNEDLAKLDKIFLGQSWETSDNVDYTPTQDIRNKVKPLLKKQARFMFGAEPTISFKPNNLNDTDECEKLRKFIDDVLEDNHFWKNTRKAFLMSTIKKRVLLRVEANPSVPFAIKYENIDDFCYKEKNGKLLQVKFFQEDEKNALLNDDTDKIYYIHQYYYDQEEGSAEVTVFYKKETYSNNNLTEPSNVEQQNTGFNIIPCWLIKNGGELNDDFGESDVEELIEPQTLYNKKNSDYADALRFQMFGSEAVIDGMKEDVDQLTIAPNSLHAIRTSKEAAADGKQASIQRQEYNMGNSDSANNYLDRIDKDMRDLLDMPTIKDLTNIPSAKAMKYLYNDLIARCEEKWSDWGPVFKDLINFIIEAAEYSYKDIFNISWKALDYTLVFDHNYPLPADEDDKKTMGMAEVSNKVRSVKSYIKEFSDEEDADKAFTEILEETILINSAENGSMQLGNEGDNNNPDNNLEGGANGQ